jgi:hypothetical protein
MSAVVVTSSWVQLAACRGHDTRLWFSTDRFDQAVAVAVCRRCPVRVQCLAEAVKLEADGQPFGVRGGLTAAERALLLSGSQSSSIQSSGGSG